MRWWVGLMVLLACSGRPPVVNAPAHPALLGPAADRMLSAGDNAGALRSYTAAWDRGERTADLAYAAATACAHLGQIDAGITWLARSIELGDWGVPLTADPELAVLRKDPRFSGLVADAATRAAESNRKLGVGADLPRSTPVAEGIDAAALEKLVHAADTSGSSGLVILHDGKVIGEWYFGGYSYRIEAMSATKSMAAVAIGLLAGDGKLRLDDPVWRFFPEWRQGRKEAITIRMLLSMTSGLAARRTTQEIYRSPDFVKLALAAELADDPGTWWYYNNEAVNLLSGIVEKASGIKLDELLRQRLFEPLGIRDLTWSHDEAGNPHAMAGMQIHPIDFAKIGQLMLDGGRWHGKQLLDPAFIAEATRPSQTLDPSYGLLWWLSYETERFAIPAELEPALRSHGIRGEAVDVLKGLYGTTITGAQLEQAMAKLPQADSVAIAEAMHAAKVRVTPTEDGFYAFSARGAFGQLMYVLPAQHLVGVRMIDSTHAEKTNELGDFGLLLRALVPTK